MNNSKCFLIILIFNFFLSNISSAQTSSVSEGCSPLEVQFFPPAGSSSFFWDFKDGATSPLNSPTNTFSNPGTYVVEFSESVGGPIVGTVNIEVFPIPVLDISADPAGGCVPLPVNFQTIETIASGIVINNYQWVFGDGGTTSGTDTPSHTYDNPGTYTVSLAIETNFPSCNLTQIFEDVVSAASVPGIGFTTNPSPAISCTAPFTVNFNNTTTNPQGITFEWDFGNGTTFSGVSPSPQTYTTEGNFTVSLTATDGAGCSGTFAQDVSVGSPVADFIVPDTICAGVETSIYNNSAFGVYSWDVGPNGTIILENLDSIVVIYETGGAADITLSVNSPAGCSNEITKTIYVDKPDAVFTLSPQYSCSEPMIVTFNSSSTTAPAEWLWTFGDGELSEEQNPVHEYNNDELTYSKNGELVFYSTLLIVNSSGCMASHTDSVTLNEPNALFMPDVASGCTPLTVEFSDSTTSGSPIVLYEWVYGDGQTASFANGDPHQHTFNGAGEYPVQLIVTNANGCMDTSYQLIIEVGDVINPDFSADLTEICPGDSVQFTNLTPTDNIDAYHYTTDNFRSFHCFQEPDLNWIFATETGPMDVTLTVEYNGCFSSSTQTDLISVKGPIAKIDYLIDCENPYDVSFTDLSMDATNITWDFGDSTTSNISNIVHTYDSTGVYWVKLSAENTATGCPISIDSIQVHVKDIQAVIMLDTLLCTSVEYMLDASNSIDVEASCFRGYTWHPSYNRPITTAEEMIPQFLPKGDQNLQLVVTDINGCRDTSSLDVRVFETLPQFTSDKQRICVPADVQFTDLTMADTTIVSWEWDFGDGNTSSEQNPSHTYTSPTTDITVTLTVMDAIGCPTVSTQTISVYQPISVISTIPFPPNLCAGDSITFNATDFTQEGSNLIYSWDLGNGVTGINNTITTAYNTGGNYSINLDILEVATGCENTSVASLEVQDFPEASFTSNMDGMPFICYPQNALFTNNSSSTNSLNYQWNFGNGQTATAINPAAGFGKGTFEVSLIATTSFGCSDTTMQSYTLIGPEGDFTIDPNMICKGESITFNLIDTVDITSFSWDFGDGVVVDDINPATHQYTFNPPSGQTVATLILRSANDACVVPVEKPIFIAEVVADFMVNDGIDTTACIGEAILFTNTSLGADLSTWDFGNGTTSSQGSPENSYTEPGDYEVSLIIQSNPQGCLDSITKTITVAQGPNTMATGDQICAGNSTTLFVNNPDSEITYIWQPANLIVGDNNAPTITTESLNSSVTFMVEGVEPSGCSTAIEVQVDVVPDLAILELDSTVCLGQTLLLPGITNEFYTYQWIPAISGCDNCPVASAVVEGNVRYERIATDIFGLGCSPDPSIFNIRVFDGATIMPNAFTPDGDQVNDHFNVVTTENLNSENVVQEFKIWNRWGNLVYDNDNPATGWNGTHKGKPAPMDSYIYRIKLSINGCEALEESGDVTLIR